MKKLLLLAVFLVSWKSTSTPDIKIYDVGGYYGDSIKIKTSSGIHVNNRIEFYEKSEAEKFYKKIKTDEENWDVKIWKMEELR